MSQPSRCEILTSSAWRHGGEKVFRIEQLICRLVKRYHLSLLGPVITVRLSSEQPKARAGLKTSSLPRCSLTNHHWLLRQSQVQIQGKLLDDKKPMSCAPVDIPGLPIVIGSGHTGLGLGNGTQTLVYWGNL